ncbi:DUF790 family protein [Aggregicoccus sp. 17bor-14]|uniref:DUF790 family protein n=1 Tax=Myxococcaceae TaxID=31 RepID=UPI00129C9F72|nr:MULTISPECIES: DUF790 family protein [Myxococcaceae]MBF5042306.1 DUF790 family protein [Simulacricoccus sp. 17bor-14]MRI88080.1 DUF790 family protein [Aggregicoccus sp. 17bor-14]
MLTRELLLFRTREGRLRPSFVSREDPALLALAESLRAELQDAVGRTREDLEEALALHAGAWKRPRVARGLVKLLLDRMDFGEPEPAVAEARMDALRTAARVLRSLPPAATQDQYAAALAAALPAPLAQVREGLYADLPPQRRLVALEVPEAGELLDRYNLALAQGHLLGARRLHLRARAPELLRVRKVLRWLKFCRLVASVHREDEDWELSVEGPAAMLSLQKKYGLQLASFLTAVPLLQRWELRAEVSTGRKSVTLVLDHKDPLVSPHAGSALGHVPEEVQALAHALEEAQDWELDLTPLPRHTGASGLCVPDLTLRHRRSGRTVALELFHAWHAGALRRRLEELRARPDPELLLGVERALLKDSAEREALEAHPQVLLFRGFPSAKRVLAWLDAR